METHIVETLERNINIFFKENKEINKRELDIPNHRPK